MINCDITKQIMSDYINGLTSGQVNSEIEEHLSACEECRQLYEEMKQISGNQACLEQTRPFTKVKKMIKKQKSLKRIAIVAAALIAAFLILLVIGQFCPQTNLPSITRLSYRLKAKDIAKSFVEGDPNKLLSGMVYKHTVGENYDFRHKLILEEVIDDYSPYIRELSSELFQDRKCSIGHCSVSYLPMPCFVQIPDAGMLLGRYNISVLITTDQGEEITLVLDFVTEDCFSIKFFAGDIRKNGTAAYTNTGNGGTDGNAGKDTENAGGRTDTDGDIKGGGTDTDGDIEGGGTDADGDIKGGRTDADGDSDGGRTDAEPGLKEKIDNLNNYIWHFNNMLLNYNLTIFSLQILREDEYNLSSGESLFTDDCTRQTDGTAAREYIRQITEIKQNSSIQDFQFLWTGYSKEKHAMLQTLHWSLSDKNGNKAIYSKDFYWGPFGYEPTDSPYTLYTENAFDEGLRTQLSEVFNAEGN